MFAVFVLFTLAMCVVRILAMWVVLISAMWVVFILPATNNDISSKLLGRDASLGSGGVFCRLRSIDCEGFYKDTGDFFQFFKDNIKFVFSIVDHRLLRQRVRAEEVRDRDEQAVSVRRDHAGVIKGFSLTRRGWS